MSTTRFVCTVLAFVVIAPLALFCQTAIPASKQAPLSKRKVDAAPSSKGGTTPCGLSVASLPLIVGVRIGMSYDDVSLIYPEIEKDKHFHDTFDKDGGGTFGTDATNVENLLKGDAVHFDLNFKDGLIQIIHIVYAEEKWTSIAAAVAQLSGLIGVGENAWVIHFDQSAVLNCDDFNFFVNSQATKGYPRMNTMSIHPRRSEIK